MRAGSKIRERAFPMRVWGFVPLSMLLLGACALVLDTPSELATHCAIDAAEGVCGSCIVAACQTAIDACCGDATCAPLLDAVDRCADEYADDYTILASPEDCRPLTAVDDEPGGALKTCIARSCSNVCGMGEISSSTSASTCSASYVNECSCTGTGDAPGNLAECAAPTTGGVCCAYQAYPAEDTRCECRWWGCKPTATGCACSTSTEGGEPTCDGAHCCKSQYSSDCACGPEPCDPDLEVELPSCVAGPATLPCESGELLVTSCTARRAP